MLRSDLYDFSDVYIVVKGTVTVTDPDDGKRNKNVAFKNNAPFINRISKVNGVQINNAELGCCNANVQSAQIQQKLQKNNKKFVELLQR